MNIHHRRTTCRLCGSNRLELAFHMKPSALAELYLKPEVSDSAKNVFPLDLYICNECGHAQLLNVIDANALFPNYIYESHTSPGLSDHFLKYSKDVASKLNLEYGCRVVDVGSNDGTLLKHFKKLGFNVLGVDPAKSIAARARKAGIPTIDGFMNTETARLVLQTMGAPADLVTANNVFAHSDDLGEMAKAISSVLSNTGTFVFEVSYLLDTVKGLVFDYIYHEHLSYHSLRPLIRFLEMHGLVLFDVDRVHVKGGSIRCFAQKKAGNRQQSSRLANLLDEEEQFGLHRVDVYRTMERQVDELRLKLVGELMNFTNDGKTIAGYGASATVTTLLHHFDIASFFEFLVDDNLIRHGTVSPGHGLPVYPSSAIYDLAADVVVVLAWRFADQIIAKHSRFIDSGGTFLVPLPVFTSISTS